MSHASRTSSILVVDDEEPTRSVVAEMLEHSGYRVVRAGDGVEAIAAAQAEQPELILLDMTMPVMDGEAFLRVRASHAGLRRIPVVCMSALHDGQTAAAHLGAEGFLPKPFSMNSLLDAAARHALTPLATAM